MDALLEKISPERRVARREQRKAARKTAATTDTKTGNKAKKGEGSGGTGRVQPPAADIETPRAGRRRRAVPVAIKDSVACRDLGCCSFVSREGKRCETRAFLEYDHIVPLAFGGGDGVEGLRLLCHRHH